MDVLENILERISEIQEQRDVYLRQADAEEQKIAKLESMYYLLEDPATQELMRDVVVGMAVQNGVSARQRQQGRGGRKALRRHAARPRVCGGDAGEPRIHGPRGLRQEHRAHAFDAEDPASGI